MSIYYKYATDGTIIVVLSYVDDCIYWYKSEALEKWFVETIGKLFDVKFLRFAHWFMSIIIPQTKYHSISVDQARYATYIVANYLDTSTVKRSKCFYKTNYPSDKIFTKDDISTSDEKVDKLTREFNIYYIACIVLLIYLLYTRVDLSVAVHK